MARCASAHAISIACARLGREPLLGMSLRLLGLGDNDNPRRRPAASRLNSVLGQGLLDHKDELEKRLQTRQMPQGDAGLKGVPMPAPPWATADSVGADAPRAGMRVRPTGQQARVYAIAGCALATTLGFAVVIAAAAGAFSDASRAASSPPPPNPPPPTRPPPTPSLPARDRAAPHLPLRMRTWSRCTRVWAATRTCSRVLTPRPPSQNAKVRLCRPPRGTAGACRGYTCETSLSRS